ncbi:hypothetical protein Pan44_39410 [Caulifigura coniformis]|uniref:DUF6298 domain-containing protein n=1 Tax=Caulifigura coniformis TaxID=2527983 RepID=A0A517SID7_9PLAN|nr:DUF6298 domain-containing protein [Caulifigura coniformis]QDT55893.1 hypothetical protein Pan44_39410 [Caulifigura coniformis]
MKEALLRSCVSAVIFCGITNPLVAGESLGPLRACPENPRYFAGPDGRAILLTGSHTWNNLQDIGVGDPPPEFPFEAYLDLLKRCDHNFIRLWRFEMTRWDSAKKPTQTWTDRKALYSIAPHPWKRTGPALARDGLPKFDLSRLDPEYFDRLRERVASAEKRGLYVSVMLFEGFGVWALADGWETHPFHADNNVNGINGDLNGDQKGQETHQLLAPEVLRLQEAYVRRVVDAVGDYDNVLYEIANESRAESYEWQAHLVRFIQELEQTRGKAHPVGMTFLMGPQDQWLKSDEKLLTGPADWISPSRNALDGFSYRTSPPPATGAKVILADTDHFFGVGGSADWAWKSMTRGHNPIFMDPFRNEVLGRAAPETWEPLRKSLGQLRQGSLRLNLNKAVPHGELASTGYCLASPSSGEYIVYVPAGRDVSIDLTRAPKRLVATWIDPIEGLKNLQQPVEGGRTLPLTAPFDGPAVLQINPAP